MRAVQHRQDAAARVDSPPWAEAKRAYAGLIAARDDVELAETFFNSVTRRVLGTVGVEPDTEFVHLGDDETPPSPARAIHRTYADGRTTVELIGRMLSEIDLGIGATRRAQEAARIGDAIETQLGASSADPSFDALEILPTVFYRNKGAYVVGRMRRGTERIPLLLAFVNDEHGVRTDAVLTTSDELSVVFGFTRSYFHVEAPRPIDLIAFLHSVMPLKRIDELYTAIGHNRHGKTALYRRLHSLLAHPASRFEIAEGKPGLVMSVFTLPAFNVVFKVIKDRFVYPKQTTRRTVMRKYELVFVRDRVGRLADAQEFEMLDFPLDRFSGELLDELVRDAGQSVEVGRDRVIVKHLYTERRVTPLDLYLQRAAAEAARDAVIDYGHCIKDLAAANIFPGDMLLKNFGVTRHGRVIFYDYDELCLLTECNFRRMPEPRYPEDELRAEPWFYVGPNDIFPEEFSAFLQLRGELGDAFLEIHADLLEVDFWHQMQQRIEAGEVMDVFPYRESRRLRSDRA